MKSKLAIAITASGWILISAYLYYDYTVYSTQTVNHIFHPIHSYELFFHIMIFLAPFISTPMGYLVNARIMLLRKTQASEKKLGRAMGLSEKEIETLEISALLHDIGKIGIYDSLLDKPDKLTDEEYKLIKKHPAMGEEILTPIKGFNDILPIIRHHHERYDGKGYPDNLKGEEIPLLARILCLADSFDPMVTNRPYRPAPGKEWAIEEIKKCSGTHFDPRIAEVFLAILKAHNP